MHSREENQSFVFFWFLDCHLIRMYSMVEMCQSKVYIYLGQLRTASYLYMI